MANYYSKFVDSFAKIAAPLYELLYKNVKWIWSSKHIEAVHTLQKALFYPLVLCLPDFQKAFKLETIASDLAIAGFLL